ncbi:hypothetical protein H257_09405 [Aphanomyces astaci]|uniref:Uncharacterized protein n=1 Tax=Aphanomyces astaci TaxID=112090 RepID=W4GBB7_APHAT|nr:hypothetical protein H257_09405 [Aphanomyces astaci]ETV76369.1 hypothetical protein H257_09405 [Aphanomyces astaci]|eukprot:XP_009833914.1 hypothetical protein H257_09405 [Aphanomyces astaci]
MSDEPAMMVSPCAKGRNTSGGSGVSLSFVPFVLLQSRIHTTFVAGSTTICACLDDTSKSVVRRSPPACPLPWTNFLLRPMASCCVGPSSTADVALPASGPMSTSIDTTQRHPINSRAMKLAINPNLGFCLLI